MQQRALRDGQGRRLLHGGGRVPAALRVPLHRAARSSSRRCPRTSTSAPSIFLDCGNIDRNPADELKRRARASSTSTITTTTRASARSTTSCPQASCTAEVIWDLMRGLGVRADAADRRGALRRAGDRHRQVHVREHRLARARDGGRPDRRRDRRARDLPAPLRGRARRASSSCSRAGSARVERFDGGLLTLTQLTRADYARHGRRRELSPRVSSTTCARSRARPSPGSCASCCPRPRRRARKVSLRATDDRVDVSAIARAQGGGGHRRAAGFSTDLEFARARRVPAQAARRAAIEPASRPADGVLLVDKPGGRHVARRGGRGAAASCGAGRRSGTPGRSTRSRPGCCSCWSGRATRAQRFLMALPKRYETVARLGFTSTTGDVDGEIAPGRMPAEPLALPTGRLRQRPPAYSAVQASAGSAPTRCARAGEAVEMPEREVEVTRFELLWRDERAGGVRDRVRLGHLRALAGRRPRRRVLPRAAAHRHRPVRGRRPTPGAFVGSTEALDFLPGVELAGDDARRAGHGVAISVGGARRRARCGCSTPTG